MINFHLKPVPHEKAAKLISDKATVTRDVFDRLPDEIRARAFVVTGIESHDVLQALRDRIAELPQGADWDDVKDDIVAGLSPYMTMEDAKKRASILMRHHGFSAYAATQAQVQDELIDVFPFRQYISTDDAVVRPTHAALNGIVLPADHSFWEKHTPPWEWNCRCDVVELTELDAEEEKARDKKRKPENQRVLKGAALTQLENGNLNRGPNVIVDVRTAKEKGGSYENNVRHLTLPYDDIAKRWDDQTKKDFEGWAAGFVIADKGHLLDWLQGKVSFIPPRQLDLDLKDGPRPLALVTVRLELAKLDQERRALSSKMSLINDVESRAGQKELKQLTNELANLRQKAREVISYPREQRGKVKFTATGPAKRMATKGAEIVESLTHPDLLPTVSFVSSSSRSMYNIGSGKITLRKTAPAQVAAHEITHGTEVQNPQVKEKALAFLKKRAGGRPAVPIRSMVGDTSRNPETGFEDEWISRGGIGYSGRDYKGHASEILTVGIERIYDDPISFAKDDPEYFDFVLTTLQVPRS